LYHCELKFLTAKSIHNFCCFCSTKFTERQNES